MTAAGQTAVVRDIFTTVHGRYNFLNHLLTSPGRGLARGGHRTDALRAHAPVSRRGDGNGGPRHRRGAPPPGRQGRGRRFRRPDAGRGPPGRSARPGWKTASSCSKPTPWPFPFPDASFDVSAVAFGMRNIQDKIRALREMAVFTAPGGQVVVLEMAFAPSAAFRPIYGFYLGWLLPRLARFLRAMEQPISTSETPSISRAARVRITDAAGGAAVGVLASADIRHRVRAHGRTPGGN